MTFAAGLFGGGMLGVLVAKIVGWSLHCAADANTGAPCNWTAYWFWGALSGAILFPVVVFALRARGRRRAANTPH